MVKGGLGFGLAGAAPTETIEAAAQEAERVGYHSFWLSHPSPPIAGAGLEALARAATVTSTLALGIGVIPLSDQSPRQIACNVRDYGLPVDRLRLGIGIGSSPRTGSLDRVRSGALNLRRALTCELTLAALGPRMCELGGQIADSVLLNWLDPDYARRSANHVREAALEAGREPPKIYAYVRTAFGEGSRARLEREAAIYSANQNYAAHFRRMGTTAVNAAISAQSESELADKLSDWQDTVDEVIIRALPGEDTRRATLSILNAAFDAFGNALGRL